MGLSPLLLATSDLVPPLPTAPCFQGFFQSQMLRSIFSYSAWVLAEKASTLWSSTLLSVTNLSGEQHVPSLQAQAITGFSCS